MSKNKIINSDEIVVRKEMLLTTVCKLAFLKTKMAIGNMREFLVSKEWHLLRNYSSEELYSVRNGKTLSDKFKITKTNQDFNLKDFKKTASDLNVIDNGLNKDIDNSGESSGMSAAQNVYKVICMQQMEWMDETV